MSAKEVQLTFAYENTNFERIYTLEVASTLTRENVKQNILAVNASLQAGTDGGLSTFFTSEEGDNFTLISSAKLIETDEEILDLTP